MKSVSRYNVLVIISLLSLVLLLATTLPRTVTAASEEINGTASGLLGGEVHVSFTGGKTLVSGWLDFSSVTLPSGEYFVWGAGSLLKPSGEQVFGNARFTGTITIDATAGRVSFDLEVEEKPLLPISFTYELSPNPSTTVVVENNRVTGTFFSATGWRVTGGGEITLPPPPETNTEVYVREKLADEITKLPIEELKMGVPANVTGPHFDYDGDGKVTVHDALKALMDAGLIKVPPPKVDPRISEALLHILQLLYGENLERYPSVEGRVWLLAMLLG